MQHLGEPSLDVSVSDWAAEYREAVAYSARLKGKQPRALCPLAAAYTIVAVAWCQRIDIGRGSVLTDGSVTCENMGKPFSVVLQTAPSIFATVSRAVGRTTLDQGWKPDEGSIDPSEGAAALALISLAADAWIYLRAIVEGDRKLAHVAHNALGQLQAVIERKVSRCPAPGSGYHDAAVLPLV